MRLFSYFLAFCLQFNTLMGQDSGYLYIESENSRPFYIRTRDSLYMSAPEGYLILAPLEQVKGDLILGFPGQAAAAFVFTIESSSWEKGLILRDMKQEGWRLYDYKESEMVNIRRLGKTEDRYVGMRKRTDPFAMRLAQLVNDTAVLYYRPLDQVAAGAAKKTPAPQPVVAKAAPPADTIAVAKAGPPADTIAVAKAAPSRDTIGLAEPAPVKSIAIVKAAPSGDSIVAVETVLPEDTIAITHTRAKDTLTTVKAPPSKEPVAKADRIAPHDSIAKGETVAPKDTIAIAKTVTTDSIAIAAKPTVKDSVVKATNTPVKDSASVQVASSAFGANIRLVSRQETKTAYIYTYEIVEGLKREKVEVEIPREN